MKILFSFLLIVLFCSSQEILAQNISVNKQPEINNSLSESDSIHANHLFILAKEFKKKVQYDSSNIYLRKASAIFKKIKSWRFLLNCLTELADNYYELADYEHAKSNLLQAQKIIRNELNASELLLAKNYRDLGDVFYRGYSRFDSALFYYKKFLKTVVKKYGKKHPETGKGYGSIGNIYDDSGKYDKALEYYNQANVIFKNTLGPNHIAVSITTFNIGHVYRKTGEYNKAIRCFRKSLEIDKKILGPQHQAIANTYNNMAIAYFHKGDTESALKYYQRALEIFKNVFKKGHPEIASVYSNLGVVRLHEGDYQSALEYYNKSLAMDSRFFEQSDLKIAKDYINIGNALSGLGKIKEAISMYSKSLAIIQKKHTDNLPLLAVTYLNIGGAYQDIGNYNVALKYSLRALNIQKKIFPSFPARIAYENYSALAEIYFLLGNNKQAIDYYQKSLKVYAKTISPKHVYYASTYLGLGDIYQKEKAYNKALAYFQKAIGALAPKFSDMTVNRNPVLEDVLSNVVLLKALKRKATGLSEIYKEAPSINILKNILNTSNLAVELIDRILDDYQSDEAKLLLEKQFHDVYNISIRTSFLLSTLTGEKKYLAEAYRIMEKGHNTVLIKSLRESKATMFSGIPDSLIQKERSLRIDLAYYETALQKEQYKKEAYDSSREAYFSEMLFNTKRSYEVLLKNLEKEYPRYYRLKYNDETITIPKLQKRLDKNSALVEYFLGDSTLYIFVVNKDSYNIRPVKLKNETKMGIQHLTKAIKKYDKTTFLQYSYSAYKTLIQPIEQDIKGKKNLIIIPDEFLYYLPFEILLTAKTSEKKAIDFNRLSYLLNVHTISYSYSATHFTQDLRQRNLDKHKNGFVAFAPVFDRKKTTNIFALRSDIWRQAFSDSVLRGILSEHQKFRPLPNSEREVQAISAIFKEHNIPAKVFLRNDASESDFKRSVFGYKFVHLATHGLINEKYPKLSGLVFYPPKDSLTAEDGILYSSENYSLNISADLLVLSSCESGLGKLVRGEGLMSLTRGFFYAGARNIVVSLWKVSDRATAKLMERFYYYILQGNSYSSSLRKAKLELIKKQSTAFPRNWAGFILLGQ